MKKYNELNNMMVNILEESYVEVYKAIEEIKDPIKRFHTREVYFLAVYKLSNK